MAGRIGTHDTKAEDGRLRAHMSRMKEDVIAKVLVDCESAGNEPLGASSHAR